MTMLWLTFNAVYSLNTSLKNEYYIPDMFLVYWNLVLVIDASVLVLNTSGIENKQGVVSVN